MSAASCVLSEDQFLCSICLDVFKYPVSTPCGHNYCRECINEYWNHNVQFPCPVCKRVYHTRPELYVNTFISEMVAQFIQSARQKESSSSEQPVAGPGEVPCDVCTGTRLKALKSCLVCQASFCETHLEPHLTTPALKTHELFSLVENLEGRMCTKHHKVLELFCKTDQMCVCMLCSALDHKTHKCVLLKEEYEDKKAELGKTEENVLKMIHERWLKKADMELSAKADQECGTQEITEGLQIFTSLNDTINAAQVEFFQTIKQKQETTEEEYKVFNKELQREMFQLLKMSSEIDQLSRCEDHLHFLQRFPSLEAVPPTTDWTKVSLNPPSYEGILVRAVAQLEETLSGKMKKVFEAELRRVRQYAVRVTLDPDVVHPRPSQSHDRNKGNKECRCVLSSHAFSSGRLYFEVPVTKWSEWTLGVATKFTDIKKEITLGPEKGFWTVCSKAKGGYVALAEQSVNLSLRLKPEKVGVFVNYEEGLVSFYDAAAAAHIYSFTGCNFTEKLFPFFSPCPNDGGKLHAVDSGCVVQ